MCPCVPTRTDIRTHTPRTPAFECVCPSPYVVGLGDTHGGPLRHIGPVGHDQEEMGQMNPVQPGWVVVPVNQEKPNEWYHLVGWTADMQPVIAAHTGIQVWQNVFGTDAYCIATHWEWVGGPAT